MGYKILPSSQVKKYLKKCKDQSLKQHFVELIYEKIAVDPKSGIPKQGDLSGAYGRWDLLIGAFIIVLLTKLSMIRLFQ